VTGDNRMSANDVITNGKNLNTQSHIHVFFIFFVIYTSIMITNIYTICRQWFCSDKTEVLITITVWRGSVMVRVLDSQVVHTHVLLSLSSIIWYWPKGGDYVQLGR